MGIQSQVEVASGLGAARKPPAGRPIDEALLGQDISSRSRRENYRNEFARATPFPHVVFHDLFAASLLDRIIDDFGRTNLGDWLRYDSASEVKRASRPGAKLGPASQDYVDLVHRGRFIDFLSDVTGIPGLLPDPTLFGGGLHEIPDGGRFSVHTDFNKHPVTALDTRLVLITYLNRDWQPSYGGALELWDDQTDRKVKDVVPLFGSSILFAHGAHSLHGHPDPVRAPNGRSRRSIATYYYTNGRPDGLDGEAVRSTRLHKPISLTRWGRAANMAKYFLPPVLVDGAKRMHRATR